MSDSISTDNHNINWKQLSKHNSDVYAWIYIPNTNIDYAIAQSSKNESDDFYLTHNIKKTDEFTGLIYREKLNSKDFSDSVTVLYGHNMINDSMFAALHKFEDKSFLMKINICIFICLIINLLTKFTWHMFMMIDMS